MPGKASGSAPMGGLRRQAPRLWRQGCPRVPDRVGGEPLPASPSRACGALLGARSGGDRQPPSLCHCLWPARKATPGVLISLTVGGLRVFNTRERLLTTTQPESGLGLAARGGPGDCRPLSSPASTQPLTQDPGELPTGGDRLFRSPAPPPPPSPQTPRGVFQQVLHKKGASGSR